MIAHDENRLGEGGMISAQAFDDSGRRRAAVDQVAEKNDARLGLAPSAVVGLDPLQHSFEQIEPAVNVPDRIGAMPIRASLLTAVSKEGPAPDHSILTVSLRRSCHVPL